jgi:hypothetical protein
MKRKVRLILVTPLGTFHKAVEETSLDDDDLRQSLRQQIQADAYSFTTEKGDFLAFNKEMLGKSFLKVEFV